MRNLKFRGNPYADKIGIDAPKTVWIAIAVSLANLADGTGLLDRGIQPVDTIMSEWQALYDNGIVPQKPKRPAR